MTRFGDLLEKSHPFRACFWLAMVPVAIHFGFQASVFVVFLYSTYANFVGDLSAWQAARAKRAADA